MGFEIKHCIFEIEYLEGDIKDTDKAMIEELLCKVEPLIITILEVLSQVGFTQLQRQVMCLGLRAALRSSTTPD